MLSLAIPHYPQKHHALVVDSPKDDDHHTDHPANSYSIHYTTADINRHHSESYLSDSPSPPPNFTEQAFSQNSHPIPPHNPQHRFPHPEYTPEDSLQLHRRMSEPAALSGPALYSTPSAVDPARYHQLDNTFAFNPPALAARSSSLYAGALHRGASTGSLRDIRHHHFEYPPHPSQHPEWKQEIRHRDTHHDFYDHRGDGFDEPISPMQPNFSGGLIGSPISGMPYSPMSENPYGPSPPGTGTSTSSSIAPLSAGTGAPCSPSRSISQHLQRSLSTSNASGEHGGIDRKTYSFVALPGNAVKKRPRRRYDEIERLYRCSWPDCAKSYGTLNHLNAHVTMQKHGSKRSPNEFKELRKQWRKNKKEQEAMSASMRRDSYSDDYDDHVGYDQRFVPQNAPHTIPHNLRPSSHHGHGLPSSVTIGMAERYSVSIDEIRYPTTQERDDSSGLGVPYEMSARQRYSGGLPSSWHGTSGSTLSRSNIQQHQETYVHSQGHPPHHSQLPQLSTGLGINRISSPPPNSAPAHSHHGSMLNRGLPQNSTLLTPLPGYPSHIPPLHNNSSLGNVAYTEGYELYDDGESRPGTGHTNISGHSSGDEYDPRSQ